MAFSQGHTHLPQLHPHPPPTHTRTRVLVLMAAGAEVIRLYEAVLGKAGFRKGMDLYFQRHDGQVRYRSGTADVLQRQLTRQRSAAYDRP